MRDDFSQQIKDVLAKRVGFLCSICSATTSGPHSDPGKNTNVGVAAHISVAASGGPRFDPILTPEQRKSIENGIWLCQNCAKKIDNDPGCFSTAKLQELKEAAEEKAKQNLGSNQRTDREPVINAAVVIKGPNAINISGPNAVVLGPKAINITGPIIRHEKP